MNATEQSAFYKRFIMASSDEENAARLYAEATKSPENFNLIMAILTRQNGNPLVQVPAVVPNLQAPVQVPAVVPNLQAPVQVPAVVPNLQAPVQAQPPLQAPQPQRVGQGRREMTRQQLLDLNALGKRERTLAINLLSLNANERKSLVNRLWRLRHPLGHQGQNR
jgi:hypothetical protein